MELKAIMLNINPGYNEELKTACKTLKDYAEYTARVRRYAEIMRLEEAVDRAINECIKEGILLDFLMANKTEAKKMSIYEYDEELHMRQTREEGYEEGTAGAILEILSELGNIPDKLQESIMKRKNIEELKHWVKLAAKASSIEEFQNQITNSTQN